MSSAESPVSNPPGTSPKKDRSVTRSSVSCPYCRAAGMVRPRRFLSHAVRRSRPMQQGRITWLHDLFKPKHALVALVMVLAPTLIYAQTRSGTLDASFGTGGKVITDFARSEDGAAAVALQPDGRIVAAGRATINGSLDVAVVRYDNVGRLDPSFGGDGRVTTGFGSLFEEATSVALQLDGKVVVAGGAVINDLNDFVAARYNTDGALDAGFGTRGKVITKFAGVSAQAYSLALQRDGKIVVAGNANIEGGLDFAL